MPFGRGPAPASRLSHAENQALATRSALIIADKRDLHRLIARYGQGCTLGQALAQAQAEIDRASARYQELKAAGEVL